jgi:hypothetical protein
MSDNEQNNEEIILNNEEIILNNEDIKPIVQEKIKKPRTEKQIEAFKLTQAKRQENIKLKKESIKPTEPIKPIETIKPIKPTKITRETTKPIIIDDSSESEEEIIHIKSNKKNKKKPKKKTIIIDDSSDSESEEEKPNIKSIDKSNKFSSQLNKKHNNFIGFCN